MSDNRFDASVIADAPWVASSGSVGPCVTVGDSEDGYCDLVPATGTDGWQAAPVDPSDSSDYATLERQFRRLADRWKAESAFMSSPMEKVALPSHLSIIALGKPVVPLLLQELQQATGHWFFALALLTGEDPVEEAMAGDMRAMADAWLKWGKTHGHI